MEDTQSWHIVKQNNGICEIVPSNAATEDENTEMIEKWGPFETKEEAIARRVGLIRAGKCQPK